MTFSADENKELLALFAPLRVADTRDGMDWLMQHKNGSFSPEIRPLWLSKSSMEFGDR
jgi:4-hydroxy-4-methyl-2-oxoglutarate aldolase